MAIIRNKEDLIKYCILGLGQAFQEIDVSEEQAINVIDEAIGFMTKYGTDCLHKSYLYTISTPSQLIYGTLINGGVISLGIGTKLVGSVSGAVCEVVNFDENLLKDSRVIIHDLELSNGINKVYVGNIIGTFSLNEEIIIGGSDSRITFLNIKVGSYDRGYYILPDNVYIVNKIYTPRFIDTHLPILPGMDLYGVYINGIYSSVNYLGNFNISDYIITRNRIETFKSVVYGDIVYDFNKHTNKLIIHNSSQNTYNSIGTIYMVDCLTVLDLDDDSLFYNNYHFKELAKAYMKRQWGNNLMLYGDITLPGGMILQSSKVYQTANETIEKLETEIKALSMTSYITLG